MLLYVPCFVDQETSKASETGKSKKTTGKVPIRLVVLLRISICVSAGKQIIGWPPFSVVLSADVQLAENWVIIDCVFLFVPCFVDQKKAKASETSKSNKTTGKDPICWVVLLCISICVSAEKQIVGWPPFSVSLSADLQISEIT